MKSRIKAAGHIVKVLKAYKQRKTICDYPVFRLWIEPTNACNLKCGICPTAYLPDEERGFMEFSTFRGIIDEVRDFAHDVFLLLRGESLLHRDIVSMIQYAHKSHLRVMLHSNATLLNDHLNKALITSGLDLISFSFDGYNKESYERIRKNAVYEDTIDKVRAFLKLRQKLHKRRPYVIVQNIRFADDVCKRADISQFKRYFWGLHVNEFREVDSDNRGGFFADGKKFKPTVSTGNHIFSCPFLWYALAVLWNGTIVPCCMDFQARMNLGTFPGDSIISAWNSKGMVTLREKMKNIDFSKTDICYNCDMLWHKRRADIPIDFLLSASEGILGYTLPRFITRGLHALKRVKGRCNADKK